jgi:magnesium-protoporphyrin IX monomethyl ester (oxidative) cyclase
MNRAEVVLINGNLRQAWNPAPAPGLGYLAGVLEKSGLAVQVVDPVPQGLGLNEVVEKAAGLNPRAIGLTCLTSYRYDTFELAAALKARKSDWKIVVGGPHVSFLAEAALGHVPAIDCVVRGEGELTLLEYLSGEPLEKVEGLTCRVEGGVLRTPDRRPIGDLDSLPFPAYHLFPDFSCYTDLAEVPREWQGIRHAPIVSSRGCPHNCVFCSSANFWRSRPVFRARSAANIADEMEHLCRNFAVRYIRFFDDNFTASKKRVHALCDEILRRGLKVHWRAEARIDGVDRELLEKMAAAGCHEIEYGVETGSPEVMARVGKKVDVRRAPEVARMTRKAGIRARAFFIVGLPEERLEDFAMSLEVGRHFDYLGAIPLLVFPGSPLCRQLEQAGKIDDSTWFEGRNYHQEVPHMEDVPLYTESFPPQDLRALAALLSDYSALCSRAGEALHLRHMIHPRRVLYFARSLWGQYSSLRGEALRLGLQLPLPRPILGAEA